MCSDDVLQEGGDMDPRDHKGDEGVTEAAEDGMAGKQGLSLTYILLQARIIASGAMRWEGSHTALAPLSIVHTC